jgi:type I restriction enzyme, S subunit
MSDGDCREFDEVERMSEWREEPLSEIIQLIGGGTPKTSVPEYWNGEIPWLSVVDFNTGKKYVFDTEKKITKSGLANSSTKLLNKGDIIISARGTVGAIAVLAKQMTFNQSCYGIRGIEEKSVTDFVYYLLKDTVSNLLQISHGGVFDTITRDTFKEINVPLPPLPEQKAIASVLSSFDDKIDLMNRQNATLEATAETLFRQWFVEEAQEDWEEKSLLDVVQLVGGGTPKTSVTEYWDSEIHWLSGGDIASNHKSFIISSEKTITELGLENSSAKLLPKYATVISARGTVGKYCLLANPMTYSQSNYGILPRYDSCYFFTYLLINHVAAELQSSAYGSVFDTITTTTFKENLVMTPSENEVIKFESSIRPYFQKMLNNRTQIKTLEKLRDNLSPKLMSGEVRVRY